MQVFRLENLDEPSTRYLTLFIYLTYLVLPSVSTTIFLAFPKFDANPDGIAVLLPSEYLAADLSIPYDSARYREGTAWAAVMIVIYPIGITVGNHC